MATQTDSQTTEDKNDQSTNRTPSSTVVGGGGAIAGLVGGIAMGAVLTILVPTFLQDMVPALYDLQGGIAGWFAHLIHSIIFGTLFALIVLMSPFRRYVNSVQMTTFSGIIWGILLWIITTGIVMPLWLKITYYTESPLIPYLHPSLFLAHVVYGVIIGVLLSSLVSINKIF